MCNDLLARDGHQYDILNGWTMFNCEMWANRPRHFIRVTPFLVSVTQPRVRVKCCRFRLHVAIAQSG